jgi:soluble lytic murein transglycosylase-like protein
MNAKFRFRIICGAAIGLLLTPVLLVSSDFISRLQDKYDGLIKSIAAEHGLEGRFVHAVIRAESAYNRFAVSAKGAQGLMQLMPATAAAYGVRDVFDPADNIRGGVKFLKVLWELYGGNTSKTLAAYNAGQEAVKKYGGVPPYAETRTYIDRVIASYQAPMPGRKTRIYEYRDDQGRLVLTNDPRLAAGRGIDGGN